VASRVPSCILSGTLIALVPHQGLSNTKIVLSISAPCQYDLTYNFMYPSCSSIQENIIFDSANDRSSLEFEKVIDIGIWESPFPFRASDQVAGSRRSSNGAQNKKSHKAQSDSTRCYVAHAQKEKLHGKPRSFLLSMVSIYSFLHGQCIFHRSLCSPSFHKSQDKISFKWGGL
jgi:hypothetical protein